MTIFERMGDFFDTAEKRDVILNGLRRVGNGKAMGFLPCNLISVCGESTEAICRELEGRGIRTKLLLRIISPYQGQVVVAWHEESLGRILWLHRELLDNMGWPSAPESFADWSMYEEPPKDSAIAAVVQEALSDQADWTRDFAANLQRGNLVRRADGSTWEVHDLGDGLFRRQIKAPLSVTWTKQDSGETLTERVGYAELLEVCRREGQAHAVRGGPLPAEPSSRADSSLL